MAGFLSTLEVSSPPLSSLLSPSCPLPSPLGGISLPLCPLTPPTYTDPPAPDWSTMASPFFLCSCCSLDSRLDPSRILPFLSLCDTSFRDPGFG